MRTLSIAALSVFFATPAWPADQPLTDRHSATFTVETKSTAAEQLAYARTILAQLAATPPGWQRVELASKAKIALLQVPQRWPSDTSAVAQAYTVAIKTAIDENLLVDAVDMSTHARNQLGSNHPASSVIAALRGTALSRLGRNGEADAAFEEATKGAGFARLEPGVQLDVLNQAAAHYERTRRYRDASKLIREAAKRSASDVHRAGMLLRSISANEQAGDVGEARADLAALDAALHNAHAKPLTNSEQAALTTFEAAVERHRKKLGS